MQRISSFLPSRFSPQKIDTHLEIAIKTMKNPMATRAHALKMQVPLGRSYNVKEVWDLGNCEEHNFFKLKQTTHHSCFGSERVSKNFQLLIIATVIENAKDHPHRYDKLFTRGVDPKSGKYKLDYNAFMDELRNQYNSCDKQGNCIEIVRNLSKNTITSYLHQDEALEEDLFPLMRHSSMSSTNTLSTHSSMRINS